MQEKTANESSLIMTRRHTPKEERKAHVDKWKQSGLTMSEYCRQNNMPLAKLSEWKRSLLPKPTKFKSICVAPPTSEVTSQSAHLIEIIVDQRIKIRLHQSTDTSLLLNIIKGLLTCS
jgi:transposase-like protein